MQISSARKRPFVQAVANGSFRPKVAATAYDPFPAIKATRKRSDKTIFIK